MAKTKSSGPPASQGAVAGGLDRYFHISERGSTVRTEIVAGFATWLTMAYILFVNPQILATTGMDHSAVFVATERGLARATVARRAASARGFCAWLERKPQTVTGLPPWSTATRSPRWKASSCS